MSLRAVDKILRQKKDARIIEVNRKWNCGRNKKRKGRDEVFFMKKVKNILTPTRLAHVAVIIHDFTVAQGAKKTTRPEKKRFKPLP